MQILRRLTVLFLVLGMALPALAAAGSRQPGADAGETLLGTWYSESGTARFNKDGTLVYNGERFAYEAANGVLSLRGANGMTAVPYKLSGGKLMVMVNGAWTTFTRTPVSPGTTGRGGSSPGDLTGKWCYLSSFSATSGGGRISDRCFTLYANGTYEYYGETSSSGQYGSAASQESDRGTWTATGTSLTANSPRYGTRSYRLEKKNHPKTGDPMLVIDGDAFVTYYQRQPW